MAFKTWTAGEQLLAADLNENFLKTPSVSAVASGSLSDGSKVVLNSDGTVSAISGVNSSNGTSTSCTASGTIGSVHGAYDSVSGKIVVAYQKNSGTSGEGCAVVGTVTGTSISFGAEAIFNATFTNSIAVCKTGIGSSKVIIAFCDYGSSQQGGIIVGTISGTTISYGSKVAFNAAVQTNAISLDWDGTNSKALLCYNSAATALKASVVTVAGTVPTVNAAVTIASVSSTLSKTSYTATSNVFVVAYNDVTNTQGKACVGTVSGTTVSFGTIVAFNAANTSNSISMCYTTSAKVVIAYQNVSDTSGKAIVGTVSGTAISFGTAVTFATGTITGASACYDAGNSKVQIGYYDNTNGKVIIGTVSGTAISFGNAATTTVTAPPYVDSAIFVASGVAVHIQSNGGLKAQCVSTFYTNLTTTNFLGCSQGAWTNGQTARVGVVGCKDTNQSSLTAGTKYYLNDDGTLSTTNTLPYFGLALSATSILIKG